MVGQPVVDEAVELGTIGLDAQHGQLIVPCARIRREFGIGVLRIARIIGEPLRFFDRRRLSKRHDDDRFFSRRHVDRAAERGDFPFMRGRARVRMAVLDHVRQVGVAALVAQEAATRRLGEFRRYRCRHKGPALHEIIARIAEVDRTHIFVDDQFQHAETFVRRFRQYDFH